MSKIGNLMSLGKESMQNSQLGLKTVAHNIANRSTEGYSRQRVDYVAAPPVGELGKRVGTGAKVDALESVRNNHLEKQIEKESQKLGMHQATSDGLMRIEQVYNEQQNKGLNRFISEFFNAFRELSNAPESLAVRTLVKEKAIALSEDFTRVHGQLRDVQKDLDFQIKSEIEEVNAMAEEVAALNKTISMVEIQNQTANDERDRRNLLLKKIGEKMNISYAENDSGVVTIMVGRTGTLVSGYDAFKMTVADGDGQNVPRQGAAEIYIHPMREGQSFNITKQINKGSIGGSLTMRDTTIEDLLERNDNMAFKLATEVNKVHIEGVDGYSQKGVLFFDLMADSKDAAAKIKVNDTVQNDAKKIAAGFLPDAPGDNRLAHKIAGIQYTSLIGDSTLDDYYNSMVGEIAVVTRQANLRRDHHDNIVKQLGNIRESISGVSLDEETTKMIELQKAFDASARVIRTADELFDTVLNLKRY